MNKQTKVWLTMAAALILVGIAIFGGTMMALKWDFAKLSTVKYEDNSYEIQDEYKNITVLTDTADIEFLPCETADTVVTCRETKQVKHEISVENDTLVIRAVDTRKWYEYIGVFSGTPKVTVCLPEKEYHALLIKESTGNIEIPCDFQFESMDISVSTGDIKNCASAVGTMKIKTSTGDVWVDNVCVGSLDLSVSTGKITAASVSCDGDMKTSVSTGKSDFSEIACTNFVSWGDTGDVSMKNVIATGKMQIERDTGNVVFDGCDGAEIFVETTTGHVRGSLLSDKVYIASTNTGKVDVPKTVFGGRCEITTDTGDIQIIVD